MANHLLELWSRGNWASLFLY